MLLKNPGLGPVGVGPCTECGRLPPCAIVSKKGYIGGAVRGPASIIVCARFFFEGGEPAARGLRRVDIGDIGGVPVVRTMGRAGVGGMIGTSCLGVAAIAIIARGIGRMGEVVPAHTAWAPGWMLRRRRRRESLGRVGRGEVGEW